MSRSGSQQRNLLEMLGRLRPHWRREPALPSRIDALLGGDRRLGSRDRRMYRELIYTAIRYLPWVEPLLESDPAAAVRRIAWMATETAATHAFRAELSVGLPDCPPAATERARVLGASAEELLPAWFRDECPEAFSPPLLDVLQSRAPLWTRLQGADKGSALSEFDRRGWAWRRSPDTLDAIALPMDADVARTEAYLAGAVEIQDVGSQLILRMAGVAGNGTWLDACAGAGGKSLQLASLLGDGGRVIARDTRRAALEELEKRANRAGLSGRISARDEADPPAGFDGVLVDAPCSGSGTWRRSPHLKWVTTRAAVLDAHTLQIELLRQNAERVRAGGLVVYATCSLCRTENQSVVDAFLQGSREFEVALAGRTLLPQSHDGDGYFVASFLRKSAPH